MIGKKFEFGLMQLIISPYVTHDDTCCVQLYIKNLVYTTAIFINLPLEYASSFVHDMITCRDLSSESEFISHVSYTGTCDWFDDKPYDIHYKKKIIHSDKDNKKVEYVEICFDQEGRDWGLYIPNEYVDGVCNEILNITDNFTDAILKYIEEYQREENLNNDLQEV
jgi:hypothetical protein